MDPACLGSWLFFILFGAVAIWQAYQRGRSPIELVIAGFIHSITFILLILTARDPGYLATGSEDPDLRFCAKCNFRQPLRTKHCADCGRCVATHDHHCFYIGGCVGERNHRMFYCLLVFGNVATLWDFDVFISIVYHRALHSSGSVIASGVLIGVLVFPVIVVVGLVAYHTYLISSAQTTWEHLSRANITYYKDIPSSVRLFGDGVLFNISNFFRRSHSAEPIRWTPKWKVGDKLDFSVFDNEHYNCC